MGRCAGTNRLARVGSAGNVVVVVFVFVVVIVVIVVVIVVVVVDGKHGFVAGAWPIFGQ